MLNHIGGTYSHNGMADHPKASIAQLNLGKFPDPAEFQCWKTNFRVEFCLKTADLQVTMLWIKEVEIAKSIDELETFAIDYGKDCPDFDMLDAMIASALKKILNTQGTLPKKSKVRGRQIAFLIYKCVRATGAHEAVQGLADLFTMSLQSDDVKISM